VSNEELRSRRHILRPIPAHFPYFQIQYQERDRKRQRGIIQNTSK